MSSGQAKSLPSQSWSIPSPQISVAPGYIEASVSSQSPSFSVYPSPSSSMSSGQVKSLPSQSWSIPSPQISVAPGYIEASVSSQSPSFSVYPSPSSSVSSVDELVEVTS